MSQRCPAALDWEVTPPCTSLASRWGHLSLGVPEPLHPKISVKDSSYIPLHIRLS